MITKKRNIYLSISIMLFIITVYFLFIRRFLMPTMTTVPVELLMAGSVVVVLLYSLLSVIILLFILMIIGIMYKSKARIKPWSTRLFNKIKLMICATFFLVILTLISQRVAYTPPILDENGLPLKNSITTIEKVNLNDSDQYITIRGKNKNNPVLLFLAGGPGGSQLAASRQFLTGLEDDFVVVDWDQPGSSKSYRAVPTKSLTIERYIEDGHELTKYLKNRFNQEKIYLVGQSWGTALGIWLVEQYPEDYKALVTAAQMVSFIETEVYCYNMAMTIAEDKGDTNTVNKLKEQGPPPYYGKGVTMKSSTYLMYLFNEMSRNPNIMKTDHNTFKDIAGPEYGLYDKVNYFLALINTFDQVYPQLYDIDLRISSTNIDVPVYILHGRHDINAPTALAEDYFNKLNAPYKELIWFENSGHDLWIDEHELFVDTMKYILNKESIS